ncbi:hypothetical protein ACOSQ4_014810 [Xanthoceras sorbifolium]
MEAHDSRLVVIVVFVILGLAAQTCHGSGRNTVFMSNHFSGLFEAAKMEELKVVKHDNFRVRLPRTRVISPPQSNFAYHQAAPPSHNA